MSRAKHYGQSWRIMKENCAMQEKVPKLCHKCVKACKHRSLGELSYCRDYQEAI